jgi:beta-glucosidase
MLGCRLEDFPPEVQRYSVVMRCILLALLAVALVCAEDQTPRERAEALLSQMTTEEKVHMLHGTLLRKDNYVGFVAQNERLGIPALRLNDGPQGFRDEEHPGSTTAWPAGLSVASTFDNKLAYAWGEAMGNEFAGKGANVFLGPGMNVARVPVNGRNFEYSRYVFFRSSTERGLLVEGP